MKDAKNPFVNSHYASLNSVMQTCREALLQNGIWLTQLPVPAPVELGAGYIGLVTKLTHAESGQWQSSFIVAPLPKNDPQGMGSALTYCRRYALTAMLGIVTEDDDAEGARVDTRQALKSRKREIQQPKNQGINNSESEKDEMGTLPKLQGIEYQYVPSQDGRQCVITPTEPLPSLPVIPHGALVILEGRAPIWRYVMAFHALHGLASAVGIYDPRLGVVVVASHSPEYREGDILDIRI